MKKYHIGLAITLSLLVVVGGVYATWRYANNAIEARTADFTVELTAKENLDRGTLALTGTIGILIDDTDNDHVAELVLSDASGDITVTFTPSGNMTVAEIQALDLQYQLQIFNHGGTEVAAVTYGADPDVVTVMEFASEEAKGVHPLDDRFSGASSTTDAVTTTITSSEILALLKTELSLPMEADYDACHEAISSENAYTLKLTVQEKVVTAPTP